MCYDIIIFGLHVTSFIWAGVWPLVAQHHVLTVPLADHLFFQSVELARMQVLWQLYFSCRCRHAGDLGNIEADSEGQAEVTITDYVVSLMGEYSVIGRTLEVCNHHWFLAKWELQSESSRPEQKLGYFGRICLTRGMHMVCLACQKLKLAICVYSYTCL